MKIMGVSTWINWSAWTTKIIISFGATATLETVLLCLPCSSSQGQSSVFGRSTVAPIWTFFLAYAFSCTMFCLMMSSMFATTALCNTMTALIWFVFYVPFTIIDQQEDKLGPIVKMVLSLFHNTALGLGLRTIIKHEANGHGLQWYNYFKSPDSGVVGTSLSMGQIVSILLVSGLIYLIIALYMDQVHPGEFGVAEPWYFPVRFLWTPFMKDDLRIPDPHPLKNDFIEMVPGAQVGLEVEKITKAYTMNRIALNGVDLKLNMNEITVILGENGAGKTTLMSILSGVISPTSGQIYFHGKNVTKKLNSLQANLGFCPQRNILFDQLTVREHIIFFALMKGHSTEEVDKEVMRYVDRLGLRPKINAESSTLSGGMKRKLSLAVALCGNSPLVFCDEPTSGIDPMARRMIWDLLREEKNNRTVLLSTHFMDEADVLSDRVAILADGRIKSYGSPLFLKNAYNTGYVLHCEKGPNCDEEKLLRLLRKHIPGLEVFSNVATELSFKLSAGHADRYEAMLKDLETNETSLGLLGLLISQSTLEEIFLL